jgi:DNA-binding transcriptional ArsR family regulator
MLNSNPLDSIYRALAEPNRRAMLEQLSARGKQSVSELKAPLDISLPAVMQHLDVLTESGLVKTYKSRGSRICELRPVGLDRAQRWIMQRRHTLGKRLDRLENYLHTAKARDEEE